uniref:CwfJ_C_2 domain-containing protein n=1 Tax=Rhabditophanes sp. KR3021 TaxID=114890 RepID=A0AC35TM61_9BILA
MCYLTYLAVVSFDGLDAQHCYIAPSQHYSSTVTLDEDVADEMKRWRTALVAMFKAADMDCVFFETAKNVKDQMHMSVECVPLPVEEGDMAPIFFKKAMTEVGSEWNTQKKFIDLAKEGSVRKVLPKGFSYFAVDFGLQPGFCHVIDDESTFPSNFAHEIIGGMLDVDDSHWRKMVPQPLNELNKKVLAFKKKFDDFDWTKKE